MTTRQEIEKIMIRDTQDLCKLVERLGYRNGNFLQQLQCSNGAFVSSLLNFFEDNPAAMEVVKNWILENSDLEDAEEEEIEECPHENKSESQSVCCDCGTELCA